MIFVAVAEYVKTLLKDDKLTRKEERTTIKSREL